MGYGRKAFETIVQYFGSDASGEKEETVRLLSKQGGPELGGIYIKGILPGGVADMNRTIMKGDRVLEVNGIGMDGLTKQQASDLLRKAPPITNLLMERHGAFDNLVLPESEFFTVELHKKHSGYGLNLTGGPEIDGVYIKQIQRDSAADHDGRIKKGDRLVTINGRNVENATRQKCTEMLKLSQDIAVLHLERCVVGDDLPPLDTVLTVVELNKGASGFGMSLTGGPEIGGIFVKALMAGGAAEKDGRILIGDRVVEMNSVSLDGFTRQQATELLKNSTTAATFVLERYKQPQSKSVRKVRATGSSTTQQAGISPTLSQQFMFPLYHGAAPSVPPRHLTNGIPSRESAFKRLEQQQMKLASHSPVHQNGRIDGMTTIQHGTPVSIQHNVQGSPVSSRIPSLIQQQYSQDKTAALSQSMATSTQEIYVGISSNGSVPSTNQTGPLTLIEAPMRYLMSNEAYEDSPQKFLQHFSKSVASGHTKPVQSRIPMGPISSAIFGKNRDNRNVHEIHDLRDNVRESARPFRDNTGLVSTYQVPVHLDGVSCTANTVNAMSNTVVCLQNGRPTAQQIKQISITDPNGNHNHTANHQYTITNDDYLNRNRQMLENQISTSDTVSTCSESSLSYPSEYTDQVKVQRMSSGHRREAMAIQSPTTNTTIEKYFDLKGDKSVGSYVEELPKKTRGLQWISLNENGTSENVSTSGTNNNSSTNLHATNNYDVKFHRLEENSLKVQSNTSQSNGNIPKNVVTNMKLASDHHAPQTHLSPPRGERLSTNSSAAIPVPLASRFNIPSITSSNSIPVPLASKFNVVSNSSSNADEYIYEVTLFKGVSGLGMNLAGGGSLDTPVTIKKIAPGTAADESGQLRVGDIILEVNGKPVSHLAAKEVISILRACPSEVQLLAKRPDFNETYQSNAQSMSTYIGL